MARSRKLSRKLSPPCNSTPTATPHRRSPCLLKIPKTDYSTAHDLSHSRNLRSAHKHRGEGLRLDFAAVAPSNGTGTTRVSSDEDLDHQLTPTSYKNEGRQLGYLQNIGRLTDELNSKIKVGLGLEFPRNEYANPTLFRKTSH